MLNYKNFAHCNRENTIILETNPAYFEHLHDIYRIPLTYLLQDAYRNKVSSLSESLDRERRVNTNGAMLTIFVIISI